MSSSSPSPTPLSKMLAESTVVCLRVMILFIQTLALYKSFTYLLTYLNQLLVRFIGTTWSRDGGDSSETN